MAHRRGRREGGGVKREGSCAVVEKEVKKYPQTDNVNTVLAMLFKEDININNINHSCILKNTLFCCVATPSIDI